MVAALISFIFYNQHLDQDGVMNINGALFMCISNMTFQNVLAVINVSLAYFITLSTSTFTDSCNGKAVVEGERMNCAYTVRVQTSKGCKIKNLKPKSYVLN